MNHTTRRPSLDAIQAVLTTVTTGSFSATSEMLEVTHGAISRRVASVEEWAGVRIFVRHGRGVRLTTEGEHLCTRLEQAIAMIDASTQELTSPSQVELLTLSVVPSFARLVLLPNLTTIEGDPRDLQVEIEIDQTVARLSSARIGVRYGIGRWPGVSAKPLFDEMLVPVASAKIASEIGKSGSAERLLDFPLMLDTPDLGWRAWFATSQINYLPRRIDRIFSDYDLVLRAAGSGLGIALLRHPLGSALADELKLVQVSDIQIPSPTKFFVVSQLGARTKAIDKAISRLIAVCEDL
ncbi:MAG: LysR family transcriptional regulator [Sphingomonas sp.]|uniref:LysR family transcriptional regulator n=1 Tax=Sphingomonas sp. TaxID=28214 RepID=UPI00182DFB4B|nr:LysR family transcriptional regulator [Sphingomonas sp.]MBA3667405.1 LysR family transcriptional regulator [Sphingomonas sp.]